MSNNAEELTARAASGETGLQPWLYRPLLELLAQGDPVAVEDLVAATGRAPEEVRAALESMPDTEYDGSGQIIGAGLTQRPTGHRFEIGGEQLYTWCALDTLIFPAVIGAPARIESAHSAAATPVRVSIDPAAGVTGVEPATAVVSLVNPEDLRSVRSSFCSQVHFFASPQEAAPWLEAHPGGSVVTVREAYELASVTARQILEASPRTHPGNGVQSCSC